jgi:UDP-GlcNAc:undecaprenyl-phosphate/decaprenyl-phosphate GlcNAc-1-phosphate transferase
VTELSSHSQLAVLFFPALLLSLWLVPLTNRLAFRIGAIDCPCGRKVHTRAIPRLGGLAMVAGLIVPLLLFQEIDRSLVAFLAGALIVAFTGFLDDAYRIPPGLKFAGEIAAAFVFIFGSGAMLTSLGDFLGVGEVRTGFLAPAVTVFCMVGVMNAFNLSDGLDGLAGGLAAIACVFLGVFAWQAGHWLPLAVLAALFGAVLGFLRYNTHPASLFMGDAGSLLLGYSLSAVAVMLVQGSGAGIELSPVPVAAVLALPIIDTLLVMGRRVWRRENPFQPDKTHLHHRLLDLGLPHAAVVSILYVSAAGFGLQAWGLQDLPEGIQFAAVLLLGAAVNGFVPVLRRLGLRWEFLSAGGLPSRDGASDFATRIMEKSVRPAGWIIAAGLILPAVALPSVDPEAGAVALAVGGAVAVLFPWRSRRARSSICYGLTYVACVSLLAILSFTPGALRWLPGYLAVLSALVLVWVLFKMKYRGYREIVLFSAFEVLLIGGSLVLPFLLAQSLGLGEGSRRTLLIVCFQSIALLLAMKIFIRRRPSRNPVIAAGLLAALAVVGARGMIDHSRTGTYLRSSGVSQALHEQGSGLSTPAPESGPGTFLVLWMPDAGATLVEHGVFGKPGSPDGLVRAGEAARPTAIYRPDLTWPAAVPPSAAVPALPKATHYVEESFGGMSFAEGFFTEASLGGAIPVAAAANAHAGSGAPHPVFSPIPPAASLPQALLPGVSFHPLVASVMFPVPGTLPLRSATGTALPRE